MIEAPWVKTPQAILAHFGVDPYNGLSENQVTKHAEKYGKNGM
jgi:P-type Ca2+ transporter type 2A